MELQIYTRKRFRLPPFFLLTCNSDRCARIGHSAGVSGMESDVCKNSADDAGASIFVDREKRMEVSIIACWGSRVEQQLALMPPRPSNQQDREEYADCGGIRNVKYSKY